MLASMSDTSGSDQSVDAGMSELPTGTVTLLLADYLAAGRRRVLTRLWETQPERMSMAVERLDRFPAWPSQRSAGPVNPGGGER
jgi:hypothetical protein